MQKKAFARPAKCMESSGGVGYRIGTFAFNSRSTYGGASASAPDAGCERRQCKKRRLRGRRSVWRAVVELGIGSEPSLSIPDPRTAEHLLLLLTPVAKGANAKKGDCEAGEVYGEHWWSWVSDRNLRFQFQIHVRRSICFCS